MNVVIISTAFIFSKSILFFFHADKQYISYHGKYSEKYDFTMKKTKNHL